MKNVNEKIFEIAEKNGFDRVDGIKAGPTQYLDRFSEYNPRTYGYDIFGRAYMVLPEMKVRNSKTGKMRPTPVKEIVFNRFCDSNIVAVAAQNGNAFSAVGALDETSFANIERLLAGEAVEIDRGINACVFSIA